MATFCDRQSTVISDFRRLNEESRVNSEQARWFWHCRSAFADGIIWAGAGRLGRSPRRDCRASGWSSSKVRSAVTAAQAATPSWTAGACPDHVHAGGFRPSPRRRRPAGPRDHQRELTVGALQETITVSGESPTVDLQTTTRQAVMNQDRLRHSKLHPFTTGVLIQAAPRRFASQDVGLGRAVASLEVTAAAPPTSANGQRRGPQLDDCRRMGRRRRANATGTAEFAIGVSRRGRKPPPASSSTIRATATGSAPSSGFAARLRRRQLYG
jgi:hypothetical protein